MKLSQEDSDAVTRLSDLSGTLVSDAAFESYLTFYPLPKGPFYAVARTWLDLQVPRPGCVLTRTLLIPLDVWARMTDPYELMPLLEARPQSQDVAELEPIEFISHGILADLQNPIDAEELDFVGKYFGESIEPLVWYDVESAEVLLWLIIRGLWPQLRRRFSACGFALQPRHISDRPFHLLFAPSVVMARYSRFAQDHLVGSGLHKEEPWQTWWADQLFSGACQKWAPDFRLIFEQLEPEPTAVRKLFVFQQLHERSFQNVTASLGLFDLLETFPDTREMRQLRSSVLKRAMASLPMAESRQVEDALDLLFLRFSRSFTLELLERERLDSFQIFIQRLAVAFPERTLATIAKYWPQISESRALRVSMFQALGLALQNQPALSRSIVELPEIGKQFLLSQPDVFINAIHSAHNNLLKQILANWLNDPTLFADLPMIRPKLLTAVRDSSDIYLLRALLNGLKESEVPDTLTVLSESTEYFEASTLRQSICDSLAMQYPVEAREWILGIKRRNSAIAELLASTYAPDPEAYKDIISISGADKVFIGETLSVWITRSAMRRSDFIYYLGRLASEDARLLEDLFVPNRQLSSEAAIDLVTQFMSAVPMNSGRLIEGVQRSKGTVYHSRIVDLMLRTFMTSAVRGSVDLGNYHFVLCDQTFTTWINEKPDWAVAHLLVTQVSSRETCENAWRLAASIPGELYSTKGSTIIAVVDSLLSRSIEFWSDAIVNSWLDILEHGRQSIDPQTVDLLAGQAVRFSLDHPERPLSPILVQSFLPVYRCIVNRKRVPETAASLFSILDWDKGKELRNLIVQRFLKSRWPPGDLALAVQDPDLLRKVFKRLVRASTGIDFAHRMYRDLTKRDTPIASHMAEFISKLIQKPDFHEEWD